MTPPTYRFSVFTPTRDRAHTLHRVYESLRAQTFRDFEWLIIDNGSSDGTGDLVEGWQQVAAFPIRYVVQENAGVHGSWNRAVAEARGDSAAAHTAYAEALACDPACAASAEGLRRTARRAA